MADELTIVGLLAHNDSTSPAVPLSVSDLLASVASKLRTLGKMSVTTVEKAIPLADVAAPGWAMFVNRDPTNFIELRVGSAGAKFAKLKPGEFALLRLGSGAQVPYAIADTAACLLEYLVCDT